MKQKTNYNFIVFIPLIFLNIISLLNMINAKRISANYNNAFIKQLIWFILGYIIIFIIQKINIRKILYYSKYFYILSVLLLILVLFVGNSINGAKCWLNIWFFSFQPSELCKISLSLYLIYIIKISNTKKESIIVFKILLLTIIPSILVFLEPDTGAIMYFIIICTVLLLSIKLNKCWYIIFTITFLIFTIFFFYNYFFNQDLLIKIFGTSFFYRMDRIINFANGNSYQLENALITIGSSSFFGIGFNSILLYIPEAATDFFFAFSIGNYGIFSSIIILLSLLFIDYFLINSTYKTKNINYKRFIWTYISIFIFQQLYNISMNIGLLPIMGIPLPFLSYGGSNTIINYIYLGLILNILKTNKNYISVV